MTTKRSRNTTRRGKKPSKKESAPTAENAAPTNEYELQHTVIEAEDKLDLPDEELEKVHSKLLEAINPNASKNKAVYSFEEKVFKLEPLQDHIAIHFSEDGVVVRKDSEEAKEMRDEEEKRQMALEEKKKAQLGVAENDDVDDNTQEELEQIDEDQLRNQFNCSHRATQTYINDFTQQSMNTDDPPTRDISENATQWFIYDSYVQYMAEQKEKNDSAEAEKQANVDDYREKTAEEILESKEMANTVKLVERMINQNINEELLEDFKFWEDESDKYKEEGSLLPLWRFSNEKTNKKHVTGLCWNPHYHDLFAVSFGSYDFTHQSGGVICCYSLKNPSYPEYMFTTESGVTAIDFHPQHSSLLAAGMHDGTVAIYDIRTGSNEPIIKSSVKSGKHTDTVWQVRWDQETISGSLSFFSVSSDGRVTSWTLSKNELQHTDVMYLKRDPSPDGKSSERTREDDYHTKREVKEKQQALHALAGGTCFDFNRHVKHLFVVGTEDGLVHQCSKAYNSQYLNTFNGHHLAAYSVKWNNFHKQLFLSGSADWNVKLWDYKEASEPLLEFDLGAAVGDVAWAPFSASVFAAVTDDGRVHVYDLNKNKHDAMCDQLVVRKAKLTHIAFNPSSPIILIGDDKGLVQCAKLSPNLKVSSEKLELNP